MILQGVKSEDLLTGDEDVLSSFTRGFAEQFGFPKDACNWLLDIYVVFQTFDDLADGDEVKRARLDQLIYKTLVDLPTNPFFAKNSTFLAPILSNAILRWKASDTAEREGNFGAMSYSWRASYYDLVLAVLSLVYGSNNAMHNAHVVMDIYKERFEDYMKEMKDA